MPEEQRTVVVAPDSFKGSFSAAEVAAEIAAGLAAAGWRPDPAPVGDGGEGTAEVLARALDGRWVAQRATGPLGQPVDAGFFLTGDGIALIDTAAASGLGLVPEAARDPATARAASTAGTGELLAAAVRLGATEIRLGVGGSATTDGGRGAIEVLRAAGGLRDVPLRVLCDVTTRYVEAADVFGPQKGADAATVQDLRRRLDGYAAVLPRDPRGVPMSGCAGGLSGGLWAAFGAELVPGAAAVLAAVGLRERAERAVAVVTGEGRFDAQSLLGKLVDAVRDASERPVHLVVGSSELSVAQARAAGFASLTIASDAAALRRAGAALDVPAR